MTVVAYGAMLHNCLDAAKGSEEEEGISCEVVDLRTLMPFDVDTVLSSVQKTGRLVIVHEAPRTCGFGAELAATVAEKGAPAPAGPRDPDHRFRHPPSLTLTKRNTCLESKESGMDCARSSNSEQSPMPYRFRLPDIGEGIVEGEVVRWLVPVGDEVEEDQPMVEVMTDKATVEIPSPVKGRVVQHGGNEGDTVQVGSVLVVIDTGKDEAESTPVHTAPHTPAHRPPIRRRRTTARVLATPAIRRLAKQMKIDLEGVKGTGPGGRITKQDLTRARTPAPVSPAVPAAAGPTERIPYRGIRRRIGDHMLQASNHAPHFTYVEEVDVTELVRMRQRAQGSEEFQGVRLTYLPYVLKALGHELKRHPDLNARLDLDAGEIELRKYYNIGVATQTKAGLMVPVIRNVDRKSLPQLAREISRVSRTGP